MLYEDILFFGLLGLMFTTKVLYILHIDMLSTIKHVLHEKAV